MENETKYPLIIIGVALLSLVAFNYEDLFTGETILKNSPSNFKQERLNLVRTVDVPISVNSGGTFDIVFSSNNPNDLIQINKEKIIFYRVDDTRDHYKKQLTYPRCTRGRASLCNVAEKSFSVPVSWVDGNYKVQIEREIKLGEKAVTEVIGRAFFNIN
ncbi:MAG: hypothetical protein CMH62_01420 [Nanoarchaeota archaeon]|nr:hypothetical protein [Nanoarchaeota archaeon]|tara:strand:- start:226 stop:702 length:477 start_codon:yes stop_codon:yes gene_type:complete